MNNKTIFTFAAIGILAYWYFGIRKKSPVTAEDLKSDKKPTDAKASTATPASNTPASLSPMKKQVELEDIPYKMPQFSAPEKRVFVKPAKPVMKEDIYVSPLNLIPNVYDANMNIAVYPDRNNYANFSGACTENIQNACRCSKENNVKYKLNIPQLP
jgi:hypothetical protein